jgi:protein-L-isoaspartate(D-aspartate) O-methyltransferase
MDFIMTDIALFNMVEQQIRPWNVHSQVLLKAITRLDRSLFVPDEQQALCFFDTAIELDGRSRMLEPRVVARLIQALDIQPDDQVLVVGAGSGYSAALCARLASTVVCQDTNQSALDRAAKNCAAAGIDNIVFQKVASSNSSSDNVEYDAILVREGIPASPQDHLKKLSVSGRCVALIGHDCVMEMICYTRDGNDINEESLIEILKLSNDPFGDSARVKQSFVF